MPSRQLPNWLVEEYLMVLLDDELDPDVRQREAVEQRAELNYRVHGGSHCGMCNTHVRHVVEATVKRGEETRVYACLCTRCLEGERSSVDRLELRLGRAILVYEAGAKEHSVRRWDDPRNEKPKSFAAKAE